ncbi:protein of unknown function [Pararobbsia alpina]
MKGIRFASSLHNAGFAEQDAKLGSAAGSVIWQGFQADNAVNEVKRKQKNLLTKRSEVYIISLLCCKRSDAENAVKFERILRTIFKNLQPISVGA